VFGYLYPAMQRANQASGRSIRKETDKGAIIFMDSRFKDKILDFDSLSDEINNSLK